MVFLSQNDFDKTLQAQPNIGHSIETELPTTENTSTDKDASKLCPDADVKPCAASEKSGSDSKQSYSDSKQSYSDSKPSNSDFKTADSDKAVMSEEQKRREEKRKSVPGPR